MTITVANGKTPLSELIPPDTSSPSSHPLSEHPLSPPPYTESATSTTYPISDTFPNPVLVPSTPRLQILAATWGGVNVTPEIRGMIRPDKFGSYEKIKLNMHTLHTSLLPDPAAGVIKTLTVLYKYDTDNEIRMLNVPQFAPQIWVRITPFSHLSVEEQEDAGGGKTAECFGVVSGTEWRDEDGDGVEILAVLFGQGRITTPSVLEELGRLFAGKRGQIRTTAAFFRADTWVGMHKSWTVFFRFCGRDGRKGRVQCVTGMEGGALEPAWGRDV
ncbi:hypothetical protein QBC47DRAFT_300683 [Echria macrotheca]|uniref:Uncharacterized protein n=1 Tax=Echria macrotheca TaxID=438768 RepID=A0AAJ0F9K8_9PEZI|nr:hypothetical protein QBC47DRAFT_300683 [Echria macrotheca]